MCGLAIELEGDVVTSIRGDHDDPFSRGHVCPKALALKELHEDPDRLRKPMRRTASGDFEEISWNMALDEVAGRLHHLQKVHGRDAVGAYVGNPNVHNLGSMLFAPSLLRTLRTKNRWSATSADQLPAMLAAQQMLGHQLLLGVPDLDRTHTLIIFGANPLASNGSLMSAGDVRGRLKGISERGEVWVFDPRRSETARKAERHDFIRPGTDAMVLLAILNDGLERHGPRLRHMADAVEGLDALRTAIATFTPEAVAERSGVSVERMREVADRLWGDQPAVVYGRVGACVQAFGGLSMWAINLLNLLSGNFDREGGWMFAQPAFDLVDAPMGIGVGRGSFGRWRSRVRGLPEFGGELPVVTLAEEILTEGEGQVRGLLTVAGNPVLSSPNGRRVEEALQSLEFFAAVDMYLNETTRHAHLILPPTSQLERSHYDLVFNLLAVRETAKWAGPAIEKAPSARHDWEILQGLTRRILNLRGTKLGPKARELALEKLGPDRVLDLGLRMGPHGTGPNPFGKGLSLNRLAATPHGVDLGPLRSCMPGRLPRHQRKVSLAPQVYLDDLPRLREDLAATRLPSALELVSRRQLRSNNSWMHNSASLMKGPRRCTLLMHPRDLEARGIESGSHVALRSRVGQVQLEVEADEDMMPGVVCMPHGFGHGREGTRMRVANESDHAGVSVNDVTDDGFYDALSGNAGFSGVSVVVEAVEVSGSTAAD